MPLTEKQIVIRYATSAQFNTLTKSRIQSCTQQKVSGIIRFHDFLAEVVAALSKNKSGFRLLFIWGKRSAVSLPWVVQDPTG